MEISIGSYKLRLEIVFLCVLVFWIMFGHALCGCCRVSLAEAFDTIKNSASASKDDLKNGKSDAKDAVKSDMTSVPATVKEGFTGANNVASGPEFSGAQTPGYIMEPSKWSMPTLTYSPGTTPDAGVQAILNRPQQPVPLPEGELDMFATTAFKPECCPNAYSSSTGCACMTQQQYTYLRQRGSNNVPYSEY